MAAKKSPPKKKPTTKAPAKKKAIDKRKKLPGAKHTSKKQVEETVNELLNRGYMGESSANKTPVKYTRKIGAEICARLAMGESLNSITRDKHMPHKASVLRWVLFCDDEEIHKDEKLRGLLCEFRDHYDYARVMQAENFMDEVTDISDDGTNDWEERETARGRIIEVPNPEIFQRSKLRVETRKWLAEVYLPKVQALRDRNVNLKSNQPLILQLDSQDQEA